MTRYKYLHQIPFDILADKEKLKLCIEESPELQFLGFTAEILSDDKLFWQYMNEIQTNSLVNLKLITHT